MLWCICCPVHATPHLVFWNEDIHIFTCDNVAPLQKGPNENSESYELTCNVPHSDNEMSESDIILISNTGISPVDVDLDILSQSTESHTGLYSTADFSSDETDTDFFFTF